MLGGQAVKSFSCLTISKREGWEKLAADSIKRQTAQPDSWILVTENLKKSFFAFREHGYYPSILQPAPKNRKPSNLNASLNAGLKLINTDYVIFYQDFIELKEDCFEKLLSLGDEKTFVTTCTPNYDGSDDGRYTGIDLPRPCRPEEWEANVALAPMRLLRELGGFEEELDWGWSWDNVHLAKRAAMLGARFVLDESNRPRLLPHEMKSRKGLTLNGEWCEKDIELIRQGKKPIKLPYL
jgi:hypothetical protein